MKSRSLVRKYIEQAANVLITDIGQSVICDFGLSHIKLDITTRSHDEPAAQHALAGTLRWQSPERLAGGGPTTQSDVYAFAITVFEVSTVIEWLCSTTFAGVYWTSSLWLYRR